MRALGLAFVLAVAAAATPAPAPAAPKAAAAAGQHDLYLTVIEDLRRQGQAHAALAHLDAFDQQFPRDPRAHILRADCLADIGRLVEAEILYRKAATGPLADEAEAGLGRIAARRKDWTAAVAAFGAAVKRKPVDPAYLNDLGYALTQAGRLDDAVFRLKQAAELAPADTLIRNNLEAAERLATGGGAGPEAKP